MTERLHRIVFVVFCLVGLYAGYQLSSIAELHSSKLLNLAGLIYAFLGVLVLSESFTTERWKSFCVTRLAPILLPIHQSFPLGTAIGSLFALRLHKPSSFTVLVFSIYFGACTLLPGIFFREIVISPQPYFVGHDINSRWRWLAFILVLGGVGAQLIAAIMDLSL